jgi:hypothetical protein
MDVDGGVVVVVADGAGGVAGGSSAAETVITAVAAALAAHTRELWTPAFWAEVLKEVDAGMASKGVGGEPRTGHQPQTPPALMETLVRLLSDHGELILDPFAGSGSTGVAALRVGRRFLGWEKDAGYAEVARKGLTLAREHLELSLRER